MMLLYLCLTLLPAAALAICYDDDVVELLFNALDGNGDYYVDAREAYDAFDQLDNNGDRRIPLDEVLQGIAVFAPELQGNGEDVFNFLDIDGNGAISSCDVEALLRVTDYNKDGVTSLDEFERYRDEVCQSNETTEYGRRY